MAAPLLNPGLHIPANVRRLVAAEGSATWLRAVPGGDLVLTTTRRGSRLATTVTGLVASADAPANTAEVDDLDFAALG